MIEKVQKLLKKRLSPPSGSEHIKVVLYKGWNAGEIQRGRFSYVHNKSITSYFLHITNNEIRVFLPDNKSNTCDFVVLIETDKAPNP